MGDIGVPCGLQSALPFCGPPETKIWGMAMDGLFCFRLLSISLLLSGQAWVCKHESQPIECKDLGAMEFAGKLSD